MRQIHLHSKHESDIAVVNEVQNTSLQLLLLSVLQYRPLPAAPLTAPR